jgi:hypothetical protein
VPTKLYVLPSYNFVLSSSSRCIIDADRCTLAPVRNGRPCDVDVQVSSRDPGILRNKTGDSVYQTQGVQRRQNERSNPGHENATRQGKGKGSGNHTYVRVLLRVCRRGTARARRSARHESWRPRSAGKSCRGRVHFSPTPSGGGGGQHTAAGTTLIWPDELAHTYATFSGSRILFLLKLLP